MVQEYANIQRYHTPSLHTPPPPPPSRAELVNASIILTNLEFLLKLVRVSHEHQQNYSY